MIKTILTGGQYNDPREIQDDTEMCKMCDMDEMYNDTDVCESCSDELDEMDTYSWCCSATIDTDSNLCYECKDNSETSLDLYCREENFNRDTYKYNKNK